MSKPSKKSKLNAASLRPSTATQIPAVPSVAPARVEPSKSLTQPTPVKVAPVAAQPVVAPVAKPAVAAPAKPAPAPIQHRNRISLEIFKPEAKHVFVAGSFNGWKPESTPLKPAGNGRWVGDLSVKPGRHEYLFVVDGQWLPDPNAKEVVQNPYGGNNSVLVVSE